MSATLVSKAKRASSFTAARNSIAYNVKANPHNNPDFDLDDRRSYSWESDFIPSFDADEQTPTK